MTRRKYQVLLIAGVLFLAYFFFSGLVNGNVYQSMLFGSLFYAPLSCVLWVIRNINLFFEAGIEFVDRLLLAERRPYFPRFLTI